VSPIRRRPATSSGFGVQRITGFITTLAFQQFTDSPLAMYPMQEGSGTVAYDYSGNDRNGTYSSCTLAQAGIIGIYGIYYYLSGLLDGCKCLDSRSFN
jgi:hypothetical protein